MDDRNNRVPPSVYLFPIDALQTDKNAAIFLCTDDTHVVLTQPMLILEGIVTEIFDCHDKNPLSTDLKFFDIKLDDGYIIFIPNEYLR